MGEIFKMSLLYDLPELTDDDFDKIIEKMESEKN